MVKRCVAAGCSNTYSDNVSLFKFPKGPVDRSGSIMFRELGPKASQMGMQKRIRLKDDAIPTLFERPGSQMSHLSDAGPSGTLSRKRASSSSSLADAGTSKKIRTAYEKRQRCRVSQFYSYVALHLVFYVQLFYR